MILKCFLKMHITSSSLELTEPGTGKLSKKIPQSLRPRNLPKFSFAILIGSWYPINFPKFPLAMFIGWWHPSQKNTLLYFAFTTAVVETALYFLLEFSFIFVDIFK